MSGDAISWPCHGGCGGQSAEDERPWLLITGWRGRVPVSVLVCPDCEESTAYLADELHDLIASGSPTIATPASPPPCAAGRPVRRRDDRWNVRLESPTPSKPVPSTGCISRPWTGASVTQGATCPASGSSPDSVIAYWNERRTAKRLVANGIWEHDDFLRGYRFLYVAKQSTPARLRDSRKRSGKGRPGSGAQSQCPSRTTTNVPVGLPPGTTGLRMCRERISMHSRKGFDQERSHNVPVGRVALYRPSPTHVATTPHVPLARLVRDHNGASRLRRAGGYLLRTFAGAKAAPTTRRNRCVLFSVGRSPLRQQWRLREANSTRNRRLGTGQSLRWPGTVRGAGREPLRTLLVRDRTVLRLRLVRGVSHHREEPARAVQRNGLTNRGHLAKLQDCQVHRLVRARNARTAKASSTGPAKRSTKPRIVPTPVVSMAGMPRACNSEMLSLAEYSSAVENPGAVRSVGGV